MKRIFIFLMSIIIITGCAKQNIDENVSNENTTTTIKKSTTTSTIVDDEVYLESEEVEDDNKTTTTTQSNVKTTTTTIKSTKTTKPSTTKRTIVSQVEKSEVTKEENKYGTIFRTIKTYTLVTYSDKTVEEKNAKTKSEIDYSGFNATTNDLKSEAATLANTYSSQINEVLGYTNQYRAEKGLAPLTLDAELTKAAMIRALEMAYSNTFSHTRPNGSKCYTVLGELNISYWMAAENIAIGYSTPSLVANGWRNSEGHYANMVNADLTKIGIGYVKINGGSKYYWVQMFT